MTVWHVCPNNHPTPIVRSLRRDFYCKDCDKIYNKIECRRYRESAKQYHIKYVVEYRKRVPNIKINDGKCLAPIARY